MSIVPPVLVALDQDRVVAGDDQSGGGVPREVVVEGEGLPLALIADGRLDGHTPEGRRRRGPAHAPALEDLIQVTERADQIGNPEKRGRVADGIAVGRPVVPGVRSARRETRSAGARDTGLARAG
jgi:hypothetical protein